MTFQQFVDRHSQEYIGGNLASIESGNQGHLGIIKGIYIDGTCLRVDCFDGHSFSANAEFTDNVFIGEGYASFSIPYIGSVYLHKPGQTSVHVVEARRRM